MIKRILFLVFIITSISASAQLTVTNNAYVYVDGNGFTSGPDTAPLYVTDDVNLIGVDSNIYLRNDAQLLQGNNVGNSGTGRLSVYQTGNSNTYTYNYWSSPVGMNSGATGNTSFRPNNNIYGETAAPITSLPATYVNEATSYNGIAGAPPTIASFWFYAFTGTSAFPNEYLDWVALDETSSNLESGYGWTMKGNPSGAQQYDFRGRPNNGNITVTINPNRETLVGNPYSSALDSYYFIHDTQNILNTTGALQFWEQQPGATSHAISNYVGGYAIYTNAATNTNGTPTDLTDDTVMDSFTPAVFRMYLLDGTIAGGPPAGTGTKIAYRYIPIGQGFTMEGSATASAIRFNNSQRVFYKQSGTNSSFFRTSETNTSSFNETEYTEEGHNIVPEDVKRFRINVSFDNNGNESYTRQLLMNFHHSATDGFDYGFEAKGAGNLESDANWTLDGEPYAIQAFEFDETLKIPLIVKISNQQLNVFSINDVQNFADDDIYIHDKLTDEYINLRDGNYETTLEVGNYTNRFEITFQQAESLHIEDITDEGFVVFQNIKNAELTVLNPNGLDIKSVTLTDITGKVVINAKDIGTQNDYRFSTKSLSEGVYIASVTVSNNQVTTKKVVIKN